MARIYPFSRPAPPAAVPPEPAPGRRAAGLIFGACLAAIVLLLWTPAIVGFAAAVLIAIWYCRWLDERGARANGDAARLGRAQTTAAPAFPTEEASVLDMVFVAVTVAFFAVSVGYVALCDRLSK